MTKTPRIDIDNDGQFVLLQSIRSILRVVGMLLFCSLVIMIGLSLNQARLNSKLNKLDDATVQVDIASKEARDAAAAAKQQVEDAIVQFSTPNPESTAARNEIYESIRNIERILEGQAG